MIEWVKKKWQWLTVFFSFVFMLLYMAVSNRRARKKIGKTDKDLLENSREGGRREALEEDTQRLDTKYEQLLIEEKKISEGYRQQTDGMTAGEIAEEWRKELER